MMDRRDFLKMAAAAGTSCSTQTIPILSRREGAKRRQAIVILGESVRYDMLNCNRPTGLKTPNLDRIALPARKNRGYFPGANWRSRCAAITKKPC